MGQNRPSKFFENKNLTTPAVSIEKSPFKEKKRDKNGTEVQIFLYFNQISLKQAFNQYISSYQMKDAFLA